MNRYISRLSDSYLGYLAHQVADDAATVEDLIQEGRIRVWTLEAEIPGKPAGFYAKAAKRRMHDVARKGNPMIGEAPHKGHIDVLADKPTVSLSAPAGDSEYDLGEVLADDVADRRHEVPELAYHRAEIREVLEMFPESQREYIFCRFWLGYTRSQLEAAGLKAGSSYWHRKARHVLAARLDHLKGAV